MTRVRTVTRFTATRAAPKEAEHCGASLGRRRNDHAPYTNALRSVAALHFHPIVRARMDRVCEPGRSFHMQLPDATQGGGNNLSIANGSGSAGAHLQRDAGSEPLLCNCGRLQPGPTDP